MFIWILVVVLLVAFWVYHFVESWAELGARMKGRNLWMLLSGSAAALIAKE